MGILFSKTMSGSYSMKGTMPAGPTRLKKGSLTTNGNGPPPLTYPADPPDDENMNEIINENIKVTVHLPDGSQHQQTVESTVPMMDLLITLAASYKLNPAAHSLKVLTGDKWKQIDFKANKTIGLLAEEDGQVSVQIVQKRDEKDKQKPPAQPFEMTYRFTVNLPHKQKKVLRISPKLSLGELRQMICEDKSFDPSRYAFLLPGSPTAVLEDSTTVGDLKTSEIDFVAIAVLDAASSRSMPNLAYEMTRQPGDDLRVSGGEKKAKRGFLSFLNKSKDNKKKGDGTSIEAVRTKKSESFSVGQRNTDNPPRPHTMYDTGELEHFNLRRTTGDLHQYSKNNSQDFRKSSGSNLAPVNENSASLISKSDKIERDRAPKAASRPKSMADASLKKSGKKRAAPPPPQASQQQTVQVEIEVNPKQAEMTRVDELSDIRLSKKNHSRNSSDSSGYHELTMSSADSPEGMKADNLQTTLDTTSIDSGDNFNGDSGIRDMSPVHRNRNKGRVKDASSRDSSHDAMDKLDGAQVVPGRKKKRAPLPPPGMSGSVSESKDYELSHMRDNSEERRLQEEEEALQAMEEVTMKFNIDDDCDDDDDMLMVENSSIHSEDLDVLTRQRPPATFIAPPPPTEPPPDDMEQVDYNPILGTINVGVGDDTTSVSPDGSNSICSRRGSNSSDSSVNTLEDLSLAFKQTIAMGQEAFGFDSDLESGDGVEDELQQAMPEFKEKISQLAGEQEEEEDKQSVASDQGNESDASFIVHDVEDNKDRLSEVSFDPSYHVDKLMPESAEITYSYTVDSVPAEFTDNDAKEDDESDEEIVTEEIVEYYPAQKNIDLDSPRHKIPDLDSPKEHRSLSALDRDTVSDASMDESEPLDNSTPKDPKEAAKLAVKEALQREKEAEEERKKKEVEEARKRQEREEFVISLDELTNVDFSAPIPEEKRRSGRSEVPKVNYRIEFRSSQDLSDIPQDYLERGSNSGLSEEDVFDRDRATPSSLNDSNVGAKTMCSDISFSPSSEGEVENVLEEKSISMIALPAERTPVKTSSNTDGEENGTRTYASAKRIVLSNSSLAASPTPSSSTVSNSSSPRMDDGVDAQALMQAQYQQLQAQFSMWQSQLLQNQKLLTGTGQEDQSSIQLQQLQIQMQMQQQMMIQLQHSMQTLALQNSLVGSTQPTVNQQVKVVPVETTSPELQGQGRASSPIHREEVKLTSEVPKPPPPPTAPKVKQIKADASYTKPKVKKFETQLDPREKLMLDIRNFGKTALKKVPVQATHWHK